MDLTKQGQFIDFLFRCLDEHQREASTLFLSLDLENERVGVLKRLLSDYSGVFDFNFINPKLLAKNASFLLSEIEKLKVEFAGKIADIEAENERQRNYFASAQRSFDDSKAGLLDSNRSLEGRVARLEEKLAQMEATLGEQNTQLERYKTIKVTRIKINSEPNFLRVGSSVTLTASVRPEIDFLGGVEWRVVQGTEGTVRIESQNEKTIVLRCVKEGEKVTVHAAALDGSGVTSSKELFMEQLKVTIDINVQQDQSIKGRIEVEEYGELTLDTSRSKYILNKNSAASIGEGAYQGGSALDSASKEVSFRKPQGEYFLHVLAVDNSGGAKEFVSRAAQTTGAQICFACTGRVQSVELEPGRYKLEAWGAQGGSFDSTYRGGFGGYSTGTINLSSKTTLYDAVGKSTNSVSGGFNGGGSGGTYVCSHTFTSYGGGGATHIGLRPGELRAFSGDYASNLLIVAGGGGGATGTSDQSYKKCNSVGGCGGGFNGAVGVCTQGDDRIATGGTQTSGGKNNYKDWQGCGEFGQGSSCGSHGCHEGGGGGGGFYGGGSGGNSGPGGGGSGYINTAKLSDASMCGYGVPASSSSASKTFSTSSSSPDAVSNSAKQNDGYAKITQL